MVFVCVITHKVAQLFGVSLSVVGDKKDVFMPVGKAFYISRSAIIVWLEPQYAPAGLL